MENLPRCLPRIVAANQKTRTLPLSPSSLLSLPASVALSSGVRGTSAPSHSQIHHCSNQLPQLDELGVRKRQLLNPRPTAFQPTAFVKNSQLPSPAVACRLGIRLLHPGLTRQHSWLAHDRATGSCGENSSVALTPATASGFRGRPPAPLYSTSISARGHATRATIAATAACLGDGRTRPTHTATTSDAIMGDRNILPGHFRPSHYDLVLTDLEFKNWTYNGSVTYANITPPSPRLKAQGSLRGLRGCDAKLTMCPQHYGTNHQAHQGDSHQCPRAEPQKRKGGGAIRQV